MLMHIVTQLSGRVTALYTQVLEWLKALLWKPVKLLPASITRVYQNVVNQRLLVALTESNISLWRVNLITAVQLIKAGLTTVKAKVIQIGLHLLTTVHQISQRVRTVLLQKKDRLVVLIKLVALRLNESKIALIHTATLLIQDGLKLVEAVKQRLLRVIPLFKKDK